MARCGILAFLFLAVASTVSARDVYLDWHITWVWAAPDGFGRPLIGINNAWPCPLVEVDLGDRLIVDVHNDLGNQSTSIHWHGFRQYSTGTMDGAVGATQCGIPPGGHMRYDFVADRSGTYWYHSHVDGQYPDGLRGPLLVRDPSPPFEYDGEFTLTLTDYYHEQMPYLIDQYAASTTADRPAGFEPLPDRTLINDTLHTTAHVEPGKTYLVHLICVGAWPGHVIVFDDHEVTVVEVDGVFVEPYKVTGKQIRLATGQRFGVLIRTKDNADRNYAIWDATDINMMFVYENRTIPEGFNPNATAWLVYDETKPLPPAPDFGEFDPNTDFVDDVIFVPIDHEALLEPVDQQIILESAAAFHDGTGRFIVNNVTYVSPDTPTLYAGLLAGASSAADPDTYGQVNPIVVEQGQVVEVVINNHHNNLHPWHLHGHQYQVVQRSAVDGGFFTGYFQNVSSTPVRRDTIMVQNNGHAVIRFRADNPDKSHLTSVRRGRLRYLHANLSHGCGSSIAISSSTWSMAWQQPSSRPRPSCNKYQPLQIWGVAGVVAKSHDRCLVLQLVLISVVQVWIWISRRAVHMLRWICDERVIATIRSFCLLYLSAPNTLIFIWLVQLFHGNPYGLYPKGLQSEVAGSAGIKPRIWPNNRDLPDLLFSKAGLYAVLYWKFANHLVYSLLWRGCPKLDELAYIHALDKGVELSDRYN